MKRWLLQGMLTTAVLVVLVGAVGCGSTATSGSSNGSGSTSGGSSAGNTAVSIKGFAFDPTSVDVKVGDTVAWTNEDSAAHNVVGDGGISSGDLAQGDTYSKTFDTAGTYAYKCAIHPTMTGTVVVK
jgi:plastocyanin